MKFFQMVICSTSRLSLYDAFTNLTLRMVDVASLDETVWDHLRADMLSVRPSWLRLRTVVRALAIQSSSSTSQLREKVRTTLHA